MGIINQSEERRKKNEIEFRDFNVANREALENVMDEESKVSFPLGMVCECSNPNCFERIELTVAQRKEIRKDPLVFVIAPGHQDNQIEKVIDQHKYYALVKKYSN